MSLGEDMAIQGESPESILEAARGYINETGASNETLYPCTTGKCKQTFANPEQLSNHKEKKHPEDRKFKCSYCPKTFQTYARVRDHEKHKR